MWFSLSHGILNEVYYPSVDSACTRDLGLVVTDGASYFSEEKRHTRSSVSHLAPGVPAFRLCNVAFDGRYEVQKEVVADPSTNVVLQRIVFLPRTGALADYRVYALLAPHLHNHGAGNTAWVGDYKGTPMLFAERDGHALALASSAPWASRSVGFVGVSDGWQQLQADRRIVVAYERAENGNVALTGELDLTTSAGECVLALAFGRTWSEAGQQALSSLFSGFDTVASQYIGSWQRWHRNRKGAAIGDAAPRSLFDYSAAVLRIHESKWFRGGVIASLSIPWGFNKADDDLGGYHLVWPRDLVEAAGGLLAVGAGDDAHRVLRFLEVTQDADGHWCQNMWLDGSAYWSGIQLDETALPILLVDLAVRQGALPREERHRYWPMVRRAAGFIVRNGPVSPQDRWEEDPGYSPFTVAAEIAALLVAADDADANEEPELGRYLRETADVWYDAIDDWMFVSGTDLAARCSVDGYYVRVAEPDSADAASPKGGFVPIKNRVTGEGTTGAAQMISPDALALVRFGLRAPDDPRIRDTVAVIDQLLKVETPNGAAWRRYNGDGYGEHADGRPFDGAGIGRPWPLLTGERGHYEVSAGNLDGAAVLLRAMEAFAGEQQLLPEQVWDGQDIAERELFAGQATGSARPLVWAHAEFAKLCRSIQEGCIFDQPPQTKLRYLVATPPACRLAVWRFNHKIRSMRSDRILRLETLARAIVHFGVDGWSRTFDLETTDTGIGVWIADLDVATTAATHSVDFTFYWPAERCWEGVDYKVLLASDVDAHVKPSAASVKSHNGEELGRSDRTMQRRRK